MSNLRQDDLPASDPLIGLWQSAPKPDPHRVLQDLQRSNRLHQRFHRSLMAILYGLAALLIFEEATGRLETHGLISVLYIAFVTASVWRRRARCKRIDPLTMDTVSLLQAMIARAKRDLALARWLYAGVPLSAAVTCLVLKVAGWPAERASHAATHLAMIQTGAGLAALAAMTATGLVLARARSVQARELSEKLSSMESDV